LDLTIDETQTSDRFEGCGWLVRSEELESVDGIADGWAGMQQLQPVPIFFSAKGRGLIVKPLPFKARLLAEIKMDDPESLFQHSWQVKNASKLFPLKSELPGSGILDLQVLSHLNRGGFSVLKPYGSTGILVRRLYDAFHGRQRARVLVDGRFSGWWFEPVEDRNRRWRWGHFGLEFGPEERTLKIEIDPAAGTPLWSVSRYEIWAISP
jgi:hypothetical protein